MAGHSNPVRWASDAASTASDWGATTVRKLAPEARRPIDEKGGQRKPQDQSQRQQRPTCPGPAEESQSRS